MRKLEGESEKQTYVNPNIEIYRVCPMSVKRSIGKTKNKQKQANESHVMAAKTGKNTTQITLHKLYKS